MVYQFVKLMSRLACVLPAGVRAVIARLLGEVCWLFVSARRREIAISNIMVALKYTRQQAMQCAKQSATRFGRMFVEVLYFPRISSKNIDQFIIIEGQQHLEDALAHGRGAVLATAHSGNWELLGAALALKGFPLVAVVKKQHNDAMDKFINEYRTLAGMHVTYNSSVREMVRLLSAGKIIGLLMDQDAHSGGVFVDFFGRKASTPPGAAALARMRDCPIVPAFITQTDSGRHRIIIKPPLWVEKTDDRAQDIAATTQRLTTIIEDHVRTCPHEWFWLHNRWKTAYKGK